MVGVLLMALDAAAGPFAPHRWQQRVVVLHDAGRGADWVDAQIDALRAVRPENVERDIVVWVCRDGGCAVDDEAGLKGTGMRLDPRSVASALRVTAPSIYLIGKDGSVKLHRTDRVDPAELHRRIDAMPMRQSEMKAQHGG
ncbi:MAG: DUF4174 domain-containing protein [Myxococcota bacterium]